MQRSFTALLLGTFLLQCNASPLQHQARDKGYHGPATGIFATGTSSMPLGTGSFPPPYPTGSSNGSNPAGTGTASPPLYTGPGITLTVWGPGGAPTASASMNSSTPTTSSMTSTQAPGHRVTVYPDAGTNCNGLQTDKWVPYEDMRDLLGQYCKQAASINFAPDHDSGSLVRTLGTGNSAIAFAIDLAAGVTLTEDDCVTNMTSVMNDCDGVPTNPFNWKHGGYRRPQNQLIKYHADPVTVRYVAGKCALTLNKVPIVDQYGTAKAEYGYSLYPVLMDGRDEKDPLIPTSTDARTYVDKPWTNTDKYYDALSIGLLAAGDPSSLNLQFTLGQQSWKLTDTTPGAHYCSHGSGNEPNGLWICYFDC